MYPFIHVSSFQCVLIRVTCIHVYEGVVLPTCTYMYGDGVFAGLITAAFFIPSLSSPVYLVCDALIEVLWLLCIVHVYVIRAQPAELPRYM